MLHRLADDPCLLRLDLGSFIRNNIFGLICYIVLDAIMPFGSGVSALPFGWLAPYLLLQSNVQNTNISVTRINKFISNCIGREARLASAALGKTQLQGQ